jgi:hypothetical protein
MGNHEYNAICLATTDAAGVKLKKEDERTRVYTAATRAAFDADPAEWAEWLTWMKGLPFALDLGGLRCVHACWCPEALALLHPHSLADDGFLQATAVPGSPERRAIKRVLCGPELRCTDDHPFQDKDGTRRHSVRVRWWDLNEGITLGEATMPPGSHTDPTELPQKALSKLPRYGSDEPPAFFGHYWLPVDTELAPLAVNIGCLDFSAGRAGPLVAYRWDGEQQLSAGKFVRGVL